MARLTITVRDVNDNAPQLRNTPYRFDVSEGATPGHLVGIMSATDIDEGDNGQVRGAVIISVLVSNVFQV